MSNLFSKEIINKIAIESSFKKRKSKIEPWMFLESLVFSKFNQEQLTLNNLATDIGNNYGVSVSKQAIDDRFNLDSISFLNLLVQEALSLCIKKQTNNDIFKDFNSVRIKDSTAFGLPDNLKDYYQGTGGNGSVSIARIQYEYDLKNGNVYDLEITDYTINDYQNAIATVNNIKKNDLIIRDLGYCSVEALSEIKEKEAWFLNRLKSDTGIFTTNNNTDREKIYLKDLEKRLKKAKKDYLEMDVYIGSRQKFPVRMIAFLVPDEIKKQRIEKKRQTQKKCCRPFNKKSIEHLGVNIYVTNVDYKSLSAKQIYNTYKLRWQIELTFKAWKSIGEIHKLKEVKPERTITLLYSKLLWLLINWEIIMQVSNEMFKNEGEKLSQYKSYSNLKNSIDHIRLSLHHIKKLQKVIKNIIISLIRNCKLEKRKGKISSLDLLI